LLGFSTKTRRNQIKLIPQVVTQIHDDCLRSAANYNPLEGGVLRRIDFLVWKPRRNVEKVASLQCGVELSPVAPANVRRAAEDISNSVLLSMVMYSRMSSRLDQEQASPHMGELIPAPGWIAAVRLDPGVCAVTESNCSGWTTRID
jgi:hypothetical protein